MPVSRSRTRAAFAVGANPNTGRPCRSRSSTAAAQHAGLAGTGRADHQHQPVVAGHRRRGVGLQHIQPVPIHGRRRCRRVGLGVHRPREDVFLLGQHRLGGEAGSGRFDPHRPAIRRPPRRWRRSGRGRRRSSTTRSAARSMTSSQRRPDICDTGRCTSQIAWITSGRPHDDRCADTASTTSSTVIDLGRHPVAGRVLDLVVEPVRRSSRPRRLRSATVSPDRRHRGRTCGRGCRPTLHGSIAARSHRDGSRPWRWRNSSTLAARATSMSPLRFENTAISSAGTPAISACPLTIGPHPTPNR